jgi:PST family polysaccharide transporter
MLKFGGYISAFNVVNYFTLNFGNILIGRFHGAEPLGLYSRAYSLLLLPISQITGPMSGVVVPALSRLQKEPERYRNYYLKAIKLIAYLSMPLVGLMGILSDDIIQLVLGKEWLAASPIFKALSVAAFCGPVSSTAGWVYVSLGQTKRMFMWSCLVVPLHILAFLIGVQWGAIGIALAHSMFVTAKVVPHMWFALSKSPVSLMSLFLSIRYPLIFSVTICIFVLATRPLLTQHGIFASLAGSLSLAVLAAFLLVWSNNSIKNDIRDISSIVMAAINQKRISAAGSREESGS